MKPEHEKALRELRSHHVAEALNEFEWRHCASLSAGVGERIDQYERELRERAEKPKEGGG